MSEAVAQSYIDETLIDGRAKPFPLSAIELKQELSWDEEASFDDVLKLAKAIHACRTVAERFPSVLTVKSFYISFSSLRKKKRPPATPLKTNPDRSRFFYGPGGPNALPEPVKRKILYLDDIFNSILGWKKDRLKWWIQNCPSCGAPDDISMTTGQEIHFGEMTDPKIIEAVIRRG